MQHNNGIKYTISKLLVIVLNRLLLCQKTWYRTLFMRNVSIRKHKENSMILALILGMGFAYPGHPKRLYWGVYYFWLVKPSRPDYMRSKTQSQYTSNDESHTILGMQKFLGSPCSQCDLLLRSSVEKMANFHLFCRQENRSTTRYDDDDDDDDQITHFASILNWHFGLFKN